MATDKKSYHDSHHHPRALSEKTRQALAGLSLEGIKLSKKSLDDIQKLDSGQMSKKDFLKNAIQRAKS